MKSPGGVDSTTTLEREDAPASSRQPRASAVDLTGRSLQRFHVVERLGEGGMGVVYKAIDSKLRRAVALKVLGGRYVADERNKELLFREARSAASLQHANIASIHELHDEGDPPFIVMELVHGETLRATLAARTLDLPEALGYARQIAAALAHAHGAGVVHRDLKADNVMVGREGQIKVLDFGLAKVATDAEPMVVLSEDDDASTEHSPWALAPTVPVSSHPTEHGRVLGTPAYMAPEQAVGESVDARADVFAFGVLLFEMLAGRFPFDPRGGRTQPTIDDAIRALARRVPPPLAQLVARCLRIRREERYPDGAAIVRALHDAQRATAGRARRRVALAVGGALVLASAAAAVVLWPKLRPFRLDAAGCAGAKAERGPDPRAIAACPGAWSGDVSNAKNLCAAGWHVCHGNEPGLASLTYEQATSVKGCFAIDAAQDNYACYPGCTAAVKLGVDSPEAIDMGAIGADCPYSFASGPSCLASGRIDASENSGTGCRWMPKLTGAVCCPGQ